MTLASAIPCAPAEALLVGDEQLVELQRLVCAPTTPQRVVLRAKVVLAASAGQSSNAIAAELSVSHPTVISWRERILSAPGHDGFGGRAPETRSLS